VLNLVVLVVLCSGTPTGFSDPPTWRPPCFSRKTAHNATTEEVKKNVPTETDQEEHHHDEDNEISHTPEPSHITDKKRRAKLEALQKARAEKTAHTLE
jgi:hypothetical protein